MSVAKLHNKETVTLLQEDYEALISGGNVNVPAGLLAGLKNVATMMLDIINDAEGVTDGNNP